jgi:hypothetical protein
MVADGARVSAWLGLHFVPSDRAEYAEHLRNAENKDAMSDGECCRDIPSVLYEHFVCQRDRV